MVVGQRAVNVDVPGNFSNTEGLLTYQEVCKLLGSGGWERVWLPDQQAPAAFGNISRRLWAWAGFDDVQSITAKADYVKDRGLAGAMLWAIGYDDFNNICGDGAFPLLTALRNQLPGENITSKPEVPPPFKPGTSHRAASSATTTTTISTPITIAHNNTRWLPPPPPPSPRRPSSTRETTPKNNVPRVTPKPTVAIATRTPVPTLPTPNSEAGYRQCSISDSFGPSLRCTSHHGKPGSLSQFYLYCFNGFFAIECSCLPGFFYNRCLQVCDADSNFLACPFRY